MKAIALSALMAMACGGVAEVRKSVSPGEKMACILALEGAVRSVEKFERISW